MRRLWGIAGMLVACSATRAGDDVNATAGLASPAPTPTATSTPTPSTPPPTASSSPSAWVLPKEIVKCEAGVPGASRGGWKPSIDDIVAAASALDFGTCVDAKETERVL